MKQAAFVMLLGVWAIVSIRPCKHRFSMVANKWEPTENLDLDICQVTSSLLKGTKVGKSLASQ